MKRSGFTMMELIIVIVVGGILAAVMMPKLERDPTREAANQIVRHIKYTQHLAMVDDVYSATNAAWFANRWKIVFTGASYSVSSSQSNNLIATDQGAQQLIDGSAVGDLSKYDVGVVLSGSCSNNVIAFDNLGRPHSDVTSINTNVLTTVCTITVTGDKTAVITVQPQTGYVHLDSIS